MLLFFDQGTINTYIRDRARRRKGIERDTTAAASQGDAGEFGRAAEEVLVGVGAAHYFAGDGDLGSGRDDHRNPPGSRVAVGEGDDREVVVTDEEEDHRGGTEGAAFRGRDGDEVAGVKAFTVFVVCGLDAERKAFVHGPDEEKRRRGPDKEEVVGVQRADHASSTSSDWQDGQTGCFPTALKRSPHSLHR